MDTYSYFPEPEEPPKKRKNWAVGCTVAAVVTVCLVLFVVVGGFAGLIALFGGEPEGLAVDVSVSPSNVTVGESFTVAVSLTNEGERNITIDEIQLPNQLLANTILTNISPEGVQGLDYGDQTAFKFDMVIAPTGRETINFSFDAINAGNVSGDIDVSVGPKIKTTQIQLGISSGAAVNDDTIEPDTVMGDIIPYQSVVQIIALVEIDGELLRAWSGSGTIISDDGLILTNAHVVLSDRYYNVVDLIVAITMEQDRPPQEMFYANVLQADANLDLAVIKVRSDLSGGSANFSSLGINPVVLGNSDSLQLGDPIVIIGYPGIGGDTITLTRGEVSGFTFEAPYGNRAFIKTSATIAGGNSGGLAATLRGEIIGVPTQVGSGDLEGMIVDCRPLVDTNRDGVIDERDSCVPTGGFINALRPLTLALPLIDAAKTGQVAITESTVDETPQEDYEMEGDVLLFEDFSDNSSGWSLFGSQNGNVDIINGQLIIDVYTDYMIFYSDLPDTYERLIMGVTATVINPAGDGDFGFVCGVRDSENFTVLEISEDGYYSIWKRENNELIYLVEWTYSELISGGGSFTLVAYCGPDALILGMDDMILAETFDPNYTPGRVGLAAGCWENTNLRIGFDDFIILKP